MPIRPVNDDECRGEPGKVAPVVDRNADLSLIGRIKAWAHGKKAETPERGLLPAW